MSGLESSVRVLMKSVVPAHPGVSHRANVRTVTLVAPTDFRAPVLPPVDAARWRCAPHRDEALGGRFEVSAKFGDESIRQNYDRLPACAPVVLRGSDAVHRMHSVAPS
jgi:hypothetical protein